MRVSRVRERVSTTLLITNRCSPCSPCTTGRGGRERHHRVRVRVEDEPSGRAEAEGQRGERRAEIGRTEVVEAIEGADRGVVDAFDGQCGKR